MTYVSASKGYRSGGFNVYASSPSHAKYDEEELWAYELGFKGELLDQRLMFNGSFFIWISIRCRSMKPSAWSILP